MGNELLYIIILPILAGLLLLPVPGTTRYIREMSSLVIVVVTGYLAILVCNSDGTLSVLGGHISFNIDGLSRLIVVLIAAFGLLVLCYALVYNQDKDKSFYPWFLITLGASYGAVLADNLLLFLTCWGILGITLYKLIPGDQEKSSAAAKKTLIMIGASDGILLLGIALVWRITGELDMSVIGLRTDNALTTFAFLTFIIGSFTKAGAFPFHTWIPDYTQTAPASSSALLPASLDKLLGIYFLARTTHGLFEMTDGMKLLLLSLGVITIIGAVSMALIQHNFKRLLGFHAVSQVGYMILGFGLGSGIGIAAGLFHMINHAIYKCGLFLAAGSVEMRTGKENLEDLGGLSNQMPLTFGATMIFALSISGIPPLNGFASKWMIYQGIIDFGTGAGVASKLWILWLGLSVFGSALTLASFIKFMGGIFLTRQKQGLAGIHEVPLMMWMPMIVLALLCIALGVFATSYFVPEYLMPVTGHFEFSGLWSSSFVLVLVLLSILLGILLYAITGSGKFRTEDSFVGGESLQEQLDYPATGFYETIREFRLMSWFYNKAEHHWFDLYELLKRLTLWFSNILSNMHNGVLSVYTVWVVAGLIIMMLIMI
jgi:formate hydrogenlyase subunit 3/multisubunit Na+/H+ antiporter MnhD subunit